MPFRWLLRKIFRRRRATQATPLEQLIPFPDSKFVASTPLPSPLRPKSKYSKHKLPSPKHVRVPLIKKRVILNSDEKHNFLESVFLFHVHILKNASKTGTGTGDSSSFECTRTVYCDIIQITDHNAYDQQKYDPAECNFLEELLSLVANVNHHIRLCYQWEEQRLATHLRETFDNFTYCVWGVAKLCLEWIDHIYKIVTPLILHTAILHKRFKSSTVSKELVISLPTSFCSKLEPIISPCTANLIRAADLNSACQSYLRQIEDDVTNLHSLLNKLKPVQEPADPYYLYASLANEDESFANYSMVHESINFKLKKALDWKSYQTKACFLHEEKELRNYEVTSMTETFYHLLGKLIQKYPNDAPKLYEEINALRLERIWQEFLVEEKFWVRQIKYDRQLAYNGLIGQLDHDHLIKWRDNNKLIDRMNSQSVQCRQKWLETKFLWEKMIPEDIFCEIRYDLLSSYDHDGGGGICDGDQIYSEFSLEPLHIGLELNQSTWFCIE